MKKLIISSSLTLLLGWAAHAQNTNLAFIPGKLAVFRGGDGFYTIKSNRQHPAFIDEYDPVTNNQANPIASIPLPTNGPGSLWFNAHAGSEGQGLTRSADHQYLTMTGYHGDLNSIAGTPSSDSYPRGFGLIDAFTNYNLIYSSPDWFGLQPGITQNNPRGIATDGSNDFWGCGTLAGTQSGGFEETGTLFWNGAVSPNPEPVQSAINSAYSMKIVNDVLYMVAKNETGGASSNGIFNFVDFTGNGGAPVPLPWIPNGVQHIVTTNLFLNFGPTYANILTFDMNPAGTVVYAADTTYGIIKFTNNAGTWTSPYLFTSNNIGSASQPKGATGCFGIAVDFSGSNAVIYATTMDEGDGANTCSNRLIRIIDNGNPGTNLVAQTLGVAHGTNEVFRGVDFTPDLTPFITAQPVTVSTTTNVATALSVSAGSAFPLTYQWQDNGINLTNDANISGATSNVLSFAHAQLTNAGNYTVIISNQYASVTSVVAILNVSAVAVQPSLTGPVQYVTNYVGNNASFSINPQGTPPFTYQWYFGATPLVDDGVKYSGSTNQTLFITNLQTSDSGSYFITVSNQGGGISNLVAVLSIQYLAPSIAPIGEPGSIVALVGQTNSLTVSAIQGTAPLTYEWFHGNTRLTDMNEFSGSGTNTLTISGITTADAGNYYLIITNAGGSVTSQVATVTVLSPPALSYVGYTNQLYYQNFNSLPDPGSTPVNTVGGGGPTTIGGITYDVANPFDFAYPLFTNISAPSGGLGLSNAMPGWYGECDGDTQGGQFGAQDGSQTTGGIISFGTLDSGSNNRALGLIATSTSGGTHFGLKLINLSASNLDYVSLNFTGEYWKTGTKPKTMAFSYSVDPAGNASTLSQQEIASSIAYSNLDISFPTGTIVGATNGNLAVNQTNLSVTNLGLSTPWTPGAALWLIWSINDATGSGQGYAIDNLSFAASATNNVTIVPVSQPVLGGLAYSATNGLTFSFTNAPGASFEFTVWSTTNLAIPFSQWQDLGHPIEVSPGTYQFNDAGAIGQSNRFYSVTSP
jgi:hypothetical protein